MRPALGMGILLSKLCSIFINLGSSVRSVTVANLVRFASKGKKKEGKKRGRGF
jgi:hypothetical protein